jgi:hypothetical protein
MIYIKMIHGWVAQHYDSDTGDCVQQEFIPDENEAVQRQTSEGEPIADDQAAELQNMEKDVALDMVQP